MEFEKDKLYILKKGTTQAITINGSKIDFYDTHTNELVYFEKKEIINDKFYRIHFNAYRQLGIYNQKYLIICNDDNLYKSILETELVYTKEYSAEYVTKCYLESNLKYVLCKACKEYVSLFDHYYDVSNQQQKQLAVLNRLLNKQLLVSMYDSAEKDAYVDNIRDFIEEDDDK